MPSLATGVGAFLQISIKADGKGDLKYDFVVLKSGGLNVSKVSLEHSKQGAKNLDEDQKEVDK